MFAGAGIFVRSFFDNLSLNPEVPTQQILTARFHLPNPRYPDADIRTRFLDRLLAQLLRATVQALDQDLPLTEIRTLAGVIERSRWFLVVFGTLFSVFGFIGLVMAAIGIYAVMAQFTGRRTREIGVRMAPGATSSNILALILSRGMWQVAIGLALGLIAAIPAVKLLAKIRLRVSSTDPLAFAVIVTIPVAIGVFRILAPRPACGGA